MVEDRPVQIQTSFGDPLGGRKPEVRTPRQEVLDALNHWASLCETSGSSRPPSRFYGNWSVSQETKDEVLWELEYAPSQHTNQLHGYWGNRG